MFMTCPKPHLLGFESKRDTLETCLWYSPSKGWGFFSASTHFSSHRLADTVGPACRMDNRNSILSLGQISSCQPLACLFPLSCPEGSC